MNSAMRTIKIEKLTLNIGAGKDQNILDKGTTLLKNITGITPVKTITQKRIAGWGLRPGLPIGCKITLRKIQAAELIKRLLAAKNNMLSEDNFDDNGNLSFGIHEYIDIPGVEYDHKIGVMGLQASLTLERPGFRIKKRKIMKRKIPQRHRITRKDAIDFMKNNFAIKIEEEQDPDRDQF
ncbi:MAG: 50S ribosomal protein L5 [Nanoarchaeota archaeon]|nr:50S ribosomal protein L5 [Nanoarchaeota archaeon]MBU1321363.1 50S ribosomal protein L5 [Nanoarchaeota archaeon]MBU1597355.1 50S ribosomal protein L5 [Nanoarchaeota archaeon]MBU2441270.1 50S ribosomal protein L5 [Nanoarchaeota archaeon]